MTTPILQVQDLRKVFRNGAVESEALKGVSFELQAGEFAAVVGPSGSGKTTLLNLVGLLDQPTSGSITLGGTPTAGRSASDLAGERLRNIGFIFQDYNLIPTLSALENVEFILWLQGRRVVERRGEAFRLLEKVGLGALVHRRPSQLSRGQQQRVAVCRAIAHRPKLILGDELTANLDHATGLELMRLLKELNQAEGTTFLYATHDPAMMDQARRILRLADGRLAS